MMSSTQSSSSIIPPLLVEHPPRSSPISLTSHEVNILIAEYLAESNLLHSAFAFKLESKLPTTTPAELRGLKVERGALIRWLHKGLCWSEVETHVTELGHKPPCSAPFTLLKPHQCVAYFPPTAFPSPPPPPPSPSRSVSVDEGPIEASSSKLPENALTEDKANEQVQKDGNTTDKSAGPQEQEGEKEKEKEREMGKEKEKHKDKGKEREKDGGATGGGGNSKGKRKASLSTAKSGGEENGKSTVGASLSNGGSGGSGSKRARVESPPTPNESSVSSKKAPGHPPLPSFSRKNTSNGSNANSKTSTTLKTGSKSSSPSANTMPLQSVPTSSSKPIKTASPETAPSRVQSSGSPSSTSIPTSNSVAKKKRPVTNNVTVVDSSSKPAEKSKRTNPTDKLGGKSGETEGLIYGTDYTLAKNLKEVPVCKEGEIASFKSHTGEVFVCAFGIREGILATGAGDASVRLWEFTPPSGSTTVWSVKEPPIICKHLPATDKKDITSIEFNPSGTLIGTASYDGIARIWTPEGELHGVLTRHSGPVFSLKFNPKGSLIATAGSDGSVCVWDAVTARLKQCYEFHSDCALDVDWFDDDTLASASKDKTIQICKVGSTIPFRTFKGHTDEINRVQWSPLVGAPEGSTSESGSKAGSNRYRRRQRRVLASCSDDATVRIWSLDGEEKPSSSFSSDDSSSTNHASPSNSTSATTSNTTATTNANLNTINTSTTSSSAAVSSFLMTGGGGGERCCLGVLKGHSKEIYSFAWSPLSSNDSETNSDVETETEENLVLATGSFDETIRIWDIQTMSCRWVLRAHTQTVFSLSFSCTGKYLASAGWDGLVVIWDTQTGKAIRHHKVPNGVGVYEIEWSKHGKVIAICQADKVVSLIGVNDLE